MGGLLSNNAQNSGYFHNFSTRLWPCLPVRAFCFKKTHLHQCAIIDGFILAVCLINRCKAAFYIITMLFHSNFGGIVLVFLLNTISL
jgi:hypothetical protein